MAGKINHNDEMNMAWQFLEGTDTSVFLTGKAGTGKTTFLRKLRELSPKRMVVLAPTGVAAINAKGQTIHSFFQLPLTPFVPGMKQDDQRFFRMSKEKKNLIKTMDLLVIDEISMVRADLLDAVDDVMRRYRNPVRPFGGVQLLLIGDLQQLAPVAKDEEWMLLSRYYDTPYFFGSNALRRLPYVTVELKHIYRQRDQKFIDILAEVRAGNISQGTMEALNSRFIPNFVEPSGEDWIRLTTHNRTAQQYNEQRLAALTSPMQTFKAEIEDNFPEYSYPTDLHLILKAGAQVMFVKNDASQAHAYYNGKIGRITAVNKDKVTVFCKEDGSQIEVTPVTWENTKFTIDPETKEIVETVDGRFTQLPLRLAWAITVHKSQGLTFDHAVVDVNYSFAHGQVYVALSRCRTLDGMVLSAPIDPRSVITDQSVDEFTSNALASVEENAARLPELRKQYYNTLQGELFAFGILAHELEELQRVVVRYLSRHSAVFVEMVNSAVTQVRKELVEVSMRFAVQRMQLLDAAGYNYAKDALLAERVTKAAAYFADRTDKLLTAMLSASAQLRIENKQTKRIFDNTVDSLRLEYNVKKLSLRWASREPFTINAYLRVKAKAALAALSDDRKTKRRSKR